MAVKAEEAPGPDGRDIVGEVAMHEALVEQRDARLVKGHQLALDPGDAAGELAGCLALDEHFLALVVLGEDLVHGRHCCGGRVVLRALRVTLMVTVVVVVTFVLFR